MTSHKLLAGYVAALATVSVAASAQAQGLGIVARTGVEYAGYTPTAFWQFPTVNNLGEIAWVGTLGGGGSVVFSSTRGTRLEPGTTVGTTSFSYTYGGHPVLNNAGDLLFTFRNPSNTTFMARQTAGGSIQTVVNFGQPLPSGNSFATVGQMAFSDSGAIAHNSIWVGPNPASGVFSPTAPILTVGMTLDGQTISGMNGVMPDGINNSGVIVARVSVGSATHIATQFGLLFSPGAVIDGRTLHSYNADASINDVGDVAFHAFFGGGSGIFTSDRLVAATGQVIDGVAVQNFWPDVALNNLGQVAYRAGLSGGRSGIFLDDKLIIRTGESISGLTVSSLGAPALNDNGLLVVHATFTDGSQGVLAGLVPEPSAVGVLAGSAALIGVLVRRRLAALRES